MTGEIKIAEGTMETVVSLSHHIPELGGVLPAFRRCGVAQALANYQEKWVKSKGYTTIVFKTRNYLRGMLVFAIQNGFYIIEVEHRPDLRNNRILLSKQLIEE